MTLAPADRVERHVTCLGCGCACDDIDVTIRAHRIVRAERACDLGAAWFGDGGAPNRALAGGVETSYAAALAAAARLLVASRHPLVHMTADLSCEAQRAAVALADHLYAAIDSVSSSTVLASVLATQEIGRATATLGEIRNRADVVVFWDVDPARYPRFAERYAPASGGLYLPEDRRRRLVAVAVGRELWTGADRTVRLAAEHETATIAALSALLADPARVPGSGAPWTAAATLVENIADGRYLAFVVDAEPAGERPASRADALCRLSHALNHRRRGAVLALRGGGNRTGAEAVMTSAAGYPMAVDFASGVPRYRPHDGSARALLDEHLADAVLVVGDGVAAGDWLHEAIGDLPCAVIGPSATTGPLASADVAIDSARAGIHEGGTALRMDEVPLPLRQMLPGPPTAVSLLSALDTLLIEARRAGSPMARG
jgi:formylmethanofuran dehydrogenase subunit B